MESAKKNDSNLLPLLSVVLVFWAFEVGKRARGEGMRAGLGKPLTFPLPLCKMSTFSPRLPFGVCIPSSVLFISLMWAG